MAFYVSKRRDRSRLLLGRTTGPPPLFTLTADAEDELHAFAGRLGLRQDLSTAAGSQPEHVTRHYTLTESERDRAVELGAQVITAREADKLEKQEADKLEKQRAAMRGEIRP